MRQTVNDFLRALIAGVLISLGCAVNAKVGGVVGALLFACGLCAIIQFRLPLFTGIVAEKPQWSMLAILAGNCAGAVAGHYLFGIELAPTTAPLLKILCGGTGTGILMVAAYKSKSFVVALLGVMLFILCGFPHCIAECGYMRMDALQWIMACLGNIIGGQIWRILDLPSAGRPVGKED